MADCSVGAQARLKRRMNRGRRRTILPVFFLRLTKLEAARDLCSLNDVLILALNGSTLETGWASIYYYY